ncbi:hypothetical protein JCM10914_2359 [Paenibacillus sp. JCM 10914]|nr:hypothetical protein JCM10914_2359 [Paenibacillus sp. JCM 10914]
MTNDILGEDEVCPVIKLNSMTAINALQTELSAEIWKVDNPLRRRVDRHLLRSDGSSLVVFPCLDTLVE